MSETPETGRPSPVGAGRPSSHRVSEVIGADQYYRQALKAMQQGQWLEAARALAALEDRYPGSDELRRAQQLLSLHLSAEEGWSGATSRRASPIKTKTVRILLVANALLYLILGLLLLLVR